MEASSSCSCYKWEFLPFVFLDVALLNFGSRVDLSGSALQTEETFPVSEMTKHGMFNVFGGSSSLVISGHCNKPRFVELTV